MKMSRWVLSFLIAILLLSSVEASPVVLASTINDLEQEKKGYEDKKIELNTGIKKKETDINTNQSEIESIRGQIQALDSKVKETNGKIKQVEDEISETTIEVEELHKSIKELEKRIKERDIVLRERVRALQVTGDTVNYLDVLLGANSFSDFIDRYSAVNTLMDADKKIMQEQADDKEQLEDEKKLVEQKLAEQEENKSELEGLKASLDSQKKEKNGLVKDLEAAQKKLAIEKVNLEEEFHEAHEMSEEVQAEISAEQKRQMEVARKAAEAKKRQEAEAKAAADKATNEENAAAAASKSGKSASSSSASASATVPSPPATAVSSGTWTRPASGSFTSGYGYRNHPISGGQRLHAGIDIANSVGTGIYAAADGVVFRAGSHSSYGNHIMITHSINGKTYTTVYAHLSSMSVSVGQVVNKGQNIGGMGSTGASTGSHLHFELHNGAYSGSSAINPVGIVPL